MMKDSEKVEGLGENLNHFMNFDLLNILANISFELSVAIPNV